MEYLIGYIIISIILMVVFIEMNKSELYQDMCDINTRYNNRLLEQVENGVAIRMAIMYLLASKLNFSINE